jgi:ABC-type antimicrobial peptide transport system permease subunit
VRRRRRELGTYAAIGFRRGQLASTVAWQATTFAVIAVVIGLPLGVAAGRTVWILVMGTIGTTTAPTVAGAALAAVAVGAVIAANLVALVPARSAARTRPTAVLRSE